MGEGDQVVYAKGMRGWGNENGLKGENLRPQSSSNPGEDKLEWGKGEYAGHTTSPQANFCLSLNLIS